jgi:thiol-disulfide isomerase/thioredoxin
MSAKGREWTLAALVAAAALGAGLYFGRGQSDQDDVRAQAALDAAVLRDDAGRVLSLAELRGKVVVLNFWATWCPPCREETPALVRAQTELGRDRVQIVGLAIDSPREVSAFKQEFGVSYPLVVLGTEGLDLMRALGNRTGALPFTLVLDASGRLHSRHLGALDERAIERLVNAALRAG